MVSAPLRAVSPSISLSVLALSSRFDGLAPVYGWPAPHMLSVLALSSRFDGRVTAAGGGGWILFQYSLCRVVLMVDLSSCYSPVMLVLSVLALSSRFDGPQSLL